MKSQRTPWILLILLIILWGLNHLAGLFDLYYMIPLYDLGMHTLGGIILGLVGVILLRKICVLRKLPIHYKVLWIVALGIFGGIGWEVFEYMQDVLIGTVLQVSWSDTIIDLVCDTVGASIVGIIYWIQGRL